METVFISSPQREFSAERKALKAYIEGDALFSRFFKVFLFEDLAASDRKPDDVYLEEVERCGVYIGLFGNDYGPEDSAGVSATEKEFDRATRSGRERLIYVKGTNDAGRHPKMQALLARAGAQLIRRRFGALPELTNRLIIISTDTRVLCDDSGHESKTLDGCKTTELRQTDGSAKARRFGRAGWRVAGASGAGVGRPPHVGVRMVGAIP
jgi:hypothetical protein